MMRENESDSGGGWEQRPEYVNPWASRDSSEDDRGSGSGPLPPDNDDQHTVAFGTPADPGGRYGQDRFAAQPGYGNQGAYGNQAGNDPWYDGGHSDNAGFGTPGWGAPGSPPPDRPRRGGRFLIFVAVAALAASIGAGVTVALDHQGSAPAVPGLSSGDIPAPHNNSAGSGSSSKPLNRARVEKKVKPGLVDIISTLKFDSETAEGTGMILTASGLVLTNNHVIDGATSVSASLVSDSAKHYRVRVLGYDDADDIALLQLVGAAGLTPESFGNSSQVSLGTPVLALGNAEGKGGATAAQGIINALDRSIQASDEGSNSTEDLTHMLQTNALIQQGDSGGALANSAGQVIGMITAANTSTSSQVGQSGGSLGFAIPINSALAIARQINGGTSSAKVYIGLPGFLGVEVVGLSASSNPRQQAADEEQSVGGRGFRGNSGNCQVSNQQTSVPAQIAPVGVGALVLGVLCGTPAQSQGMVSGDVITSVDGQAITTPDSLTTITARYHPGTVVSVGWEDIGGAKHKSSITLGSGPAK
jgi:S1-C subfamily serine protease